MYRYTIVLFCCFVYLLIAIVTSFVIAKNNKNLYHIFEGKEGTYTSGECILNAVLWPLCILIIIFEIWKQSLNKLSDKS